MNYYDVEGFKACINDDQREWVKKLFDLVEIRFQNTLSLLQSKSRVLDTVNDNLLILLFFRTYHRILSYFPENNPLIKIDFLEENTDFEEKIETELIIKTANEILDDIFWWSDVINERAEHSENIRKLIKAWDKTKYPRNLFLKADHIYNLPRKKGSGKHTLDTALEKALSEFVEFKNITYGSPKFSKIKDVYKKFRAPNKKKLKSK